MSIKPIDLQTLFVKMDEVSKEQSLIKEHSALQQSQAARAQVIQELEDDHRVTQTPEDSEDQAVQEDTSGNDTESGRENEEHSHHEKMNKQNRTVVTDPDVGQHIDIKG
ncbi:MAG: hypothetical protein CSA76_03085 [Spirochaetales bacterium]|nr:MAG: hypothetical protein CSA76_03085 [Spirochaetales bacterium]